MVRVVLLFLGYLLLASSAVGQVYAMDFKDPKFAKGYKKFLYTWNGRQVVLVEIRGGLSRDSRGAFTWKPNDRLEFYVQDQSNPLNLAYKIDKDGLMQTKKKSLTIGISGDRFAGLTPFMRNESFHTLALEYQRRLDSLDQLKALRKEESEGSAAWFSFHQQYVREMELLQMWLQQTGYPKAANKLERELFRAKKRVSVAKKARKDAAINSIHKVDVDPDLTAVAHELGGPDLNFHTQESMHLKIVYHTGIDDEHVSRLLELGETAIDGFRTQFVDPYRDEEFQDFIPDNLFLEFFFSTDQRLHYEKFYEDYFQASWGSGADRERRLNIHGTSTQNGNVFVSYWMCDKDADLEGIVIHQLGHRLAERHYQMHGSGQDWLAEGVAYYLSFNFLNRNSVTCIAFKPPPPRRGGTMAKGANKKKKKEETQTVAVMRGLRDVMAGVAIHEGIPFSQLVPKRLYDFENGDTAKSWAFYTYIAEEKGKAGQLWLRSLAPILFEDNFQLKIRELTEKLFELHGADPMMLLEEDWSQYMQSHYDI